MKKIAVVLSGCGVFDGAEIHEATLSMLAIAQKGCSYEIFAPDVDQHHVINHITGEEMDETRNVLIESSRIARGNITDLDKFNPAEFDGLLFPGVLVRQKTSLPGPLKRPMQRSCPAWKRPSMEWSP